MIEKPISDGNEKSKIVLRARDLEPNDLAITINAGIKSRIRKIRIIGTITPKLSQEQY
jgi:hypothetical protein